MRALVQLPPLPGVLNSIAQLCKVDAPLVAVILQVIIPAGCSFHIKPASLANLDSQQFNILVSGSKIPTRVLASQRLITHCAVYKAGIDRDCKCLPTRREPFG